MLLLLALVAASCSGTDVGLETRSVEDSSLVAVVPVDRTVERLIVVSSDPGSVSAIESVAALELVAEIIVVGDGVCPNGPSVRCVADASSLVGESGRQAIVSLDGAAAAGELEPLFSSTNAIVVLSNPGPSGLVVLATMAKGIPFRVVPPDLEAAISVQEVAVLVGVRDEIAAYASVEIDTDVFAAVVRTVLNDRVDALDPGVESDADQFDDVPEPTIRWTHETPVRFGSQESFSNGPALADGVLAFLGNDGVARGLDVTTGEELWATPIISDARIPPWTFTSIGGDTVLMRVGDATPVAGQLRPAPPFSIWALDLDTGEARWVLENEGSAGVGHPATDDERVYVWFAVSPEAQALRALDLRDR